jgi:hypothetical protein
VCVAVQQVHGVGAQVRVRCGGVVVTGDGKPVDLVWRQSPWDHRVHAYREFGDVTCEAVCGHCAPTSRVIVPLPDARACLGCQLLVGDMLADQQNDTWR